MSEEFKTLEDWVREATDLRFGGKLPSPETTPTDVLKSLLETCQRLDRLEELLLQALRLKASAQRSQQVSEAIVDEAWARANLKARQASVVRSSDSYYAPRDRYADCDLEVLEERRAHRKAVELYSRVLETHDYLRTAHRGLDSTRQDLRAIIRTSQVETSLER